MPLVLSVVKLLGRAPTRNAVPIKRRFTTTTGLKEVEAADTFSDSKKLRLAAEVVGAGVWWWVLWYLWDQYDTLATDYCPDPRSWLRYKQQFGIPVQIE